MPVSRLSYAVAATALAAAALAPALPAAAAPAPACPGLSGGANADLVRLATGLRIASTAAQMSAAQTSATARALDGPLAAVVQAPPTNSGKRLGSPAVDAGAARVGTGDLRAQATWPTGYRCGTPGPAATSSVALAEAAVLPGGSGTGTLRLAGSPSSGADVSLSTRDGHLASSATARVGLADLRLFDGSGSPVRVKVLSQPQLSAVAGGTVARSAVRYTAPVYEVTGPAGTTRRLDAAGQRIDIPLPASVLRLSIGTVTRHVTATAVTAEAATLRVQLFAGGTAAPSLDLGVGVLQVSANAPVEVPVPVTARPPATLPLTGVDTGWLVGIGLLTAIGGRLLLLLSRRRTRSY